MGLLCYRVVAEGFLMKLLCVGFAHAVFCFLCTGCFSGLIWFLQGFVEALSQAFVGLL